ncbi:MAG: hypothetical protein IJ466_07305 [Clostridia bacterium]|nr:hypothetical protein [Clostridia bacterium]
MSLKDRIQQDNRRVFMQFNHFAEMHSWNGRFFRCVTDEEAALKRKNNNVVDVSWDNNTTEVLIYVPEKDFPGKAVPNEHGIFDKKPMKVLQVQNDMGMLAILLMSNEPKVVGR